MSTSQLSSPAPFLIVHGGPYVENRGCEAILRGTMEILRREFGTAVRARVSVDASPEIKTISNYISHIKGGRGAVRDVIEQVMKVQGKWHTYFDGKHD